MQCIRTTKTHTVRALLPKNRRCIASNADYAIKRVPVLPSWDLEDFKSLAFDPAAPAKLPFSRTNLPLACQKWFVENDSPSSTSVHTPELNVSFWERYGDLIVPIEVIKASNKIFHRSSAPLKLFIDHSTAFTATSAENDLKSANTNDLSLYIAQCPLSDLPGPLQDDLSTPSLVWHAGKGDVYDSSLWMGRPPTFTPLHKDPNPNLFVQLAGQKVVRLFPPEIGRAIFDLTQQRLGRNGANANFRGEEMMQGMERKLLEDAVWNDQYNTKDGLRNEGFEARVAMGEGIFIPKGWWHSVRGIGNGMNASVNWWFR